MSLIGRWWAKWGGLANHGKLILNFYSSVEAVGVELFNLLGARNLLILRRREWKKRRQCQFHRTFIERKCSHAPTVRPLVWSVFHKKPMSSLTDDQIKPLLATPPA